MLKDIQDRHYIYLSIWNNQGSGVKFIRLIFYLYVMQNTTSWVSHKIKLGKSNWQPCQVYQWISIWKKSIQESTPHFRWCCWPGANLIIPFPVHISYTPITVYGPSHLWCHPLLFTMKKYEKMGLLFIFGWDWWDNHDVHTTIFTANSWIHSPTSTMVQLTAVVNHQFTTDRAAHQIGRQRWNQTHLRRQRGFSMFFIGRKMGLPGDLRMIEIKL